jgi:hypothetical protein
VKTCRRSMTKPSAVRFPVLFQSAEGMSGLTFRLRVFAYCTDPDGFLDCCYDKNICKEIYKGGSKKW